MSPENLARPAVPIGYLVQAVELAEERGVLRAHVLKDIDLPAALLEQPEVRISLPVYGRVMARVLRLSGDPGLGFEFGLRSVLTAHGFLGLGIMSQRTLKESIEFAARYFVKLRFPGCGVYFAIEGAQGVIDLRATVSFGPIHRCAFEVLLTMFAHVLRQRMEPSEIGLSFVWSEPEYFARYRSRLPPVRFLAGANQLHFPAHCLGRELVTANAVTARLVAEHCERDLAALDMADDVLARVRRLLASATSVYPNLEDMADRLCTSSRTLKRRLRMQGFGYQQLVDEVRYRNSISLLRNPALTIEEIALRLGYSSAANFYRAFRRWSGTSVGAYRSRQTTATDELA